MGIICTPSTLAPRPPQEPRQTRPGASNTGLKGGGELGHTLRAPLLSWVFRVGEDKVEQHRNAQSGENPGAGSAFPPWVRSLPASLPKCH